MRGIILRDIISHQGFDSTFGTLHRFRDITNIIVPQIHLLLLPKSTDHHFNISFSSEHPSVQDISVNACLKLYLYDSILYTIND